MQTFRLAMNSDPDVVRLVKIFGVKFENESVLVERNIRRFLFNNMGNLEKIIITETEEKRASLEKQRDDLSAKILDLEKQITLCEQKGEDCSEIQRSIEKEEQELSSIRSAIDRIALDVRSYMDIFEEIKGEF
jgi:K+/H+ antiporter YhaU regulatory subunit KhtT